MQCRLPDPEPLSHNLTAYRKNLDELVKAGHLELEEGLSLRDSDIGPEVTHIYQVENKGPSDVIQAQVYILWPSSRPDGDPLLYLTAQPRVEGKGRCSFVADVNPYQLQLERGSRYLMSSSSSFVGASNLRPVGGLRERRQAAVDLEDEEDYPDRSGPDEGPAGVPKVPDEGEGPDDNSKYFGQLDCGPTQCTYISCTVGPLRKREYVVFRVRSRLWTSTVAKLPHREFEVSSRMVARISELPHQVDPSYLGIRTFTVTSRVVVLQDFSEYSGGVPIWILLLAILAGLVFLACLSFVLWHFGFFRRTRFFPGSQHHGYPGGDRNGFAQAGVLIQEHEKQPLTSSTASCSSAARASVATVSRVSSGNRVSYLNGVAGPASGSFAVNGNGVGGPRGRSPDIYRHLQPGDAVL